MKHRLPLLAGGAVLLALAGGIAIAQVTVPKVLSVGPTDLFQVVVKGSPGPGNSYATAAQVSGVFGYKNGGAASTGFAYTFTAGQRYYFIQPADTLDAGALTTEANPGNGQVECLFSTQIVTALTWTANTGQTLDTAVPSAGAANALQCIQYNTSAAKWYRVS